jgi:putative alpha-1,2-mannosidase
VELRVGISFIDEAHAKANLAAQGASLTFDEAVGVAAGLWRAELGRLTVGGVSDNEMVRRHIALWRSCAWASASACMRVSRGPQVKIYSAMYRTFMSPTVYSESDGQYLGADFKVYTVDKGAAFVSDLSLWDIYRTQAPWLVLMQPDVAR